MTTDGFKIIPPVTFRSDSDVTLVQHMGGDEMVPLAAWVSFDADSEERLEGDGWHKLIAFLSRERHDSCFEHSVFTFRITTPIFVTREIHRHRSSSFNELSGRYSELEPVFYIPEYGRPLAQVGKAGAYSFERGTNEQYAIATTEYRRSCEQSWDSYQNMLNAGIAKEVARGVLPVNIYTKFYMTVNARNLMHFLGLRWHNPQALKEIREVAGKMDSIFAECMPITHHNFTQRMTNA